MVRTIQFLMLSSFSLAALADTVIGTVETNMVLFENQTGNLILNGTTDLSVITWDQIAYILQSADAKNQPFPDVPLAVFSDDDAVRVIADSSTSDIINNGHIVSRNNTGIQFEGGTQINSIENYGLINARNGIRVNNATLIDGIDNQGAIWSSYYGILVEEGSTLTSFNNAGVILSDDTGVSIDDSLVLGDVINRGEIISPRDPNFEIVGSRIGGDFINSGVIGSANTDLAVAVIWGSEIAGDFINSGKIRSSDGSPVYLSGVRPVWQFSGFLLTLNYYLVFPGTEIAGDIINTGIIEVPECDLVIECDGTKHALYIGPNFEVKGDILNEGEIINWQGAEYGIGASIYIGLPPMDATRPVWEVDEGNPYSGDLQTIVHGDLNNSGVILARNNRAIWVDNGILEGLNNLESGVIASNLSDFGITEISHSSVAEKRDKIVSSIGSPQLNDGVPYLPCQVDCDSIFGADVIVVENGGRIGSITNQGIIAGTINFGSEGGIFNAAGGITGSVWNASHINLVNTEPNVSLSDSQQLTASTVIGDFQLSHATLGVEIAATDTALQNGALMVFGDAELLDVMIDVAVTGDNYIAGGSEFSILFSTGDLDSDITSVEDNSVILNFSASQRDNRLVLLAHRINFSDLLNTGENLFQGTRESKNILSLSGAVDQAVTRLAAGELNEQSEIARIINDLSVSDDPEYIAAAIASLQPNIFNAPAVAANNARRSASNTIFSRQISLRGSGETGMVAGDEMSNHGFWIQLGTNDIEQKNQSGMAGFDADANGLSLGIDALISADTMVGMAFSYTETELDYKNGLAGALDVQSYQLSAYGTYSSDHWFFDGQLAYGVNRYDGERLLYNRARVTSDYEGEFYAARLDATYTGLNFSSWQTRPVVELEYSYLSDDSFREKGAGSAALQVKPESIDAFNVALGMQIFKTMLLQNGRSQLTPSAWIKARYDLIDDEAELRSHFIGLADASFRTEGYENDQLGYELGISLEFSNNNRWNFGVSWSLFQQDDYRSGSFLASLNYLF